VIFIEAPFPWLLPGWSWIISGGANHRQQAGILGFENAVGFIYAQLLLLAIVSWESVDGGRTSIWDILTHRISHAGLRQFRGGVLDPMGL
jgi:hypothetical protein